MRFIGDVHGKIDQYVEITRGCQESVQVGDMGVGFVDVPVLDSNHRFIRGNHDNPSLCLDHPNWIPDGTSEFRNSLQPYSILYIGGAWSIDRAYRTEGINWWPDEELGHMELLECIKAADRVKPRVIVSHDMPQSLAEHMFNAIPISTRTQQALDVIWQTQPPEFWIFGHWHKDRVEQIDNTTFICLNELSYIDLDV